MTPEQEKAKKVAISYADLSFAINDPNYPSDAHTKAALLRVEDKIKQMWRNYVFKLVFEKMMPEQFKKIMEK